DGLPNEALKVLNRLHLVRLALGGDELGEGAAALGRALLPALLLLSLAVLLGQVLLHLGEEGVVEALHHVRRRLAAAQVLGTLNLEGAPLSLVEVLELLRADVRGEGANSLRFIVMIG